MNKQDIIKALRAGCGVYLNGQRSALVQPDGNRISITYKSGRAAVWAIPREERTSDNNWVYWLILDESDDATERALQITQERDQ